MTQQLPYVFVIDGEIVPYVRRTRQGRHSARARRYHASQNRIAWQFKAQMQARDWAMLPGDAALSVTMRATIARRINTKDVDNITKALLDAMQGVVFENDRRVWDIIARTRPGEADTCTVMVGLIDPEDA